MLLGYAKLMRIAVILGDEGACQDANEAIIGKMLRAWRVLVQQLPT